MRVTMEMDRETESKNSQTHFYLPPFARLRTSQTPLLGSTPFRLVFAVGPSPPRVFHCPVAPCAFGSQASITRCGGTQRQTLGRLSRSSREGLKWQGASYANAKLYDHT